MKIKYINRKCVSKYSSTNDANSAKVEELLIS
jgi:hypothetical protein